MSPRITPAHHRPVTFAVAALLTMSLGASLSPARSQSTFSGCGSIVPAVTCGGLFQADVGGLYLLQNIGAFQIRDRVFVSGILDPGCFTVCMQGNGCILQNTIVCCGPCNPSTPFCFGDGSSGACPCGNGGYPGRGCENSATTGGARLTAPGTTTPDTIILTTAGEAPSALTIFLQGTSQMSPVTYGDGLRCFGGVLKRLFTHNASGGTVSAPSGSDLSITHRSAQLNDPIAPGSTRYYMTYYRDSAPSFCTAHTFNGSNAVELTW